MIKADHNRFLRHEGSNEEQQKPVRDGAGGPAPQTEHPVVDGEPRLLVEAHDAQRRRDRPPARGEKDTRDQDQTWRQTPQVKKQPKGCIHTASTRARSSAWHRPLPGWLLQGTNPCERRWSRWPARMRCASGSPPTLGPAVALRSSEQTAAIHSIAGARGARLALAADRQGGQRPGPVVAARGLGHAGGLQTPILRLDEALDFVATEGFFWINA